MRMNKNIEKEYKILVNEFQFNQLCELYQPLTFTTQVNVYFDTETHAIKKCKGAMRIRTKNNKHTFTLKMYQGNDLLEFETNVEENSVNALNNDTILSLLASYHIEPPFISIATLRTDRAVFEDDDAELCFDHNFYNSIEDYEIEYEYKREHDGFSKFNRILKRIGLKYESNCTSKIGRALKIK